MTEGRTFTSNHVKLLKHLPQLKSIQDGESVAPILVHVSLTNVCNLTCSFCCFANRNFSERLSLEKVKQALDSFKVIGVRSIEFTGGGEPTLHPDFAEISSYAHGLGFKLGLCTNGKTLGSSVKKDTISLFSWVRLGLYGFTEKYDYDLSVFEGTNTEVSGAYIWDEDVSSSINPNVSGAWENPLNRQISKNYQKRGDFLRMIDWVETNRIPTRIAFNVIKDPAEVEKNIETLRSILSNRNLKYAFLSDFNFKNTRRNDKCYMHLIKPLLFTDGNLYPCPCSEMSLENGFNVNSDFKMCDIDGIEEFYSRPPCARVHSCKYCKYAMQNELIDDILIPTKHNEFV